MSENKETAALAPEKSGESTMSIQDIISLCLTHWKWFVFSLVICMSIGTVYLLRTPKVYVATASVLIKEEGKGKNAISADVSGFSNMGIFTTKTNVNNELASIKSPSVILEVVRRLNLDKNYTIDGTFHRLTLYGETLPVQVRFINAPDNQGCSFTLYLDRAKREVKLNDFKFKGEEFDEEVIGAFNDTLTTPVGKVEIVPTTYYDQPQNETIDKIYVSRSSLQAAVGKCSGSLNADITDKETSIIDLTYHDVNVRRAEEFISTLISVYNENWVRDKNLLATSTSKFINERLGVIESELGNVDSDISSYKSEHLIPDLSATTAMYLGQNQEASKAILELNNQLYMARYIRDFISSSANNYQLLPANSGLQGSNIESQITAYNEKLLQRNSLLANSSLSNPLVQDMDANLSSMRNMILGSVDNEINAITTRIRSYNNAQNQSTSRLQSNPTQAQYLLSVERQQKVKEALYLFLLQKREENELSQAFTAYNTRIITPPMGNPSPVSPVSRNILLISFLAGILIPLGIIILLENMNTRVRSRKDLESLTVPFVGEIPFAARRRRTLKQRITKPISRAQGDKNERKILVKEGSRGMINEAFRVVRGNLEFMLGTDGSKKVIMVASITAGSGKTFVISNLAATFALKGLKVVLIDLDLRKAAPTAPRR